MNNTDNDKKWRDKWLAEIDESTPPLADFVKNEPIPVVPKKKSALEGFLSLLSQRRIAATAAVCVMIVMIVAVTLVVRSISDDHTVPPAPQGTGTVLAVEINPAVLFATGTDGSVSSVVALNEDADTVMALDDFSTRVIGKPLNEAVTAYADMCARLGFINYSGDAVRISGITGDARLDGVRVALSEHFKTNGIFAVIDTGATSEQSFGDLYGIDISEKTLTEAVGSMTATYSERCASNKSMDELRAEYESEIIDGRLDKYIKEAIESQLDQLEGILPEFIVNKIRESITENLSGNRDAIIEVYKDLFDDEDAESKMDNLTSTPENLQEYNHKMNEYAKFRSGELEKENKAEYEATHEAIGNEAYDDFVQGIIDEYGSLGAYFESQKNK